MRLVPPGWPARWAKALSGNPPFIWLINSLSPRYRQQIKINDFKNPRWCRPPSWKFAKSQYCRNGTTDFDKIWYNHASGSSGHCQPIKHYGFENQRRRRPPSWKTEKNLLSSQPIDRFWQSLACLCFSTLSAPIANKISGRLFALFAAGGQLACLYSILHMYILHSMNETSL